MSEVPQFVEIDLTRGDRSRHPDLFPWPVRYLAQIHGQFFFGYFTEEHYGWNFADGWGASGHQFDTPGYNLSRWERLWQMAGIGPSGRRELAITPYVRDGAQEGQDYAAYEESLAETAADLHMDASGLRNAFSKWVNTTGGCVVEGLTSEANAACYAVYRLTKLKQALRSTFLTIERRTFAVPVMQEEARKALLAYMEMWSETNYAAGWLTGLAETMAHRKDPGYIILTQAAGGTYNDNREFVEDPK